MPRFCLFIVVLFFCVAAVYAGSVEVPPPFASGKLVKAMPKVTEQKVFVRKNGRSVPDKQWSIVCGDNKLVLDQKNPLKQSLFTGGNPFSAVSVFYWGKTSGGSGMPFKGDMPKVTEDSEKNLHIVKKYRDTANSQEGIFTENIAIAKDGIVKFDYSYTQSSHEKVSDQGLLFSFKLSKNITEMRVAIDNHTFQISKEKQAPGVKMFFEGHAREVVFFPDKPAQSFRLLFPENTSLYLKVRKIKSKWGNWKSYGEMRVKPAKNGQASFKLDMRNTYGDSLKKSNSFLGINFWKNDRINIPDFAASRNLLPNPSFESGLRYYDNFFTWGRWPGKDYSIYNIDTKSARTGKRCLRVSAFKSYPDPNYLTTFTVPTQTGKKYTFSFYAKALGPNQQLNFTCVTAQWGKFPKWQNFKLAEQWKRYSLSFTAPNSAAVVMFRIRNRGTAEQTDTLIDDLQFEQNEKVTEFVNRNFASELLTSDLDNFLPPNQKVQARIRIQATANQSGTIQYKVRDYYYRIPAQGVVNFKTDASGEAMVKLPLDGKIGNGVFVLEANFNLKNGKKYKDLYRLARMKLIDDDFKHRELFACGSSVRTCRGEAAVKRLRGIGFGTNNYQSSELMNSLFKKYGIRNTSSGVIGYGPKGKGKTAEMRKATTKRLKSEKYSKDLAQEIKTLSSEMVKENKWVDEWFLQGECNAGGGKFKVLKDRDNVSFVKLILACYDGVKQTDKTKRFAFTGGPPNMFKSAGIRDIDTWLGIAEKLRPGLKFDSIAIHPYRAVPEAPDLDDDVTALLDMLKKHGYDEKTPINWNEGIYHNPYQIPEWGLDPHKGCSTDHWRCGTPTYDMGWGERIAAAYYARSWLVGLKYGDRINSYNGWSGTCMSIDTQMTPLALQKIPNTLANLLGNATFKEDIRFAPHLRSYIFEDQKKRPVAVLWSYKSMVDRGFEASPVAQVKLSGLNPEFIDLMENKASIKSADDGTVQLPVTPFPLFIRTKPGTMSELCSALKNARLTNSKDFAVNISMKLKDRNQVVVDLFNMISRNFQGQVIIPEYSLKKSLDIPEMEHCTLNVNLKKPVPVSEIKLISMPLELSEKDGASVKRNLSFHCLAVQKTPNTITVDGNGSDWSNIPTLKMDNMTIIKRKGGASNLPLPGTNYNGPADFSVNYKLSWDDEFFYMLINVKDDTPWFPAMENVSSDWRKDSVQVYFDTLGDNAQRVSKGRFDFNDYNYDISLTQEDNKVRVYRRVAPEQQIAGGLDAPKPNMVENGVKAAVRITEKGYVYEVAFPRLLIAPLQLKKNYFFRLGMMVNDNDGKRRKGGMSNIPQKGMTPYEDQEQWPGIILVD